MLGTVKNFVIKQLLGSAQQSSILKLAAFDNSATTCQKQKVMFVTKNVRFGSVFGRTFFENVRLFGFGAEPKFLGSVDHYLLSPLTLVLTT